MNSSPLFSNAIKKGSQVINYQNVRWYRPRKPFWLGLAKSKMFVVREPKVTMNPEEAALHRKLTLHYNTKLKSIINFITNDSPKWKGIGDTDEEESFKISPELQKRIDMSFKLNDEWNEETRKLGEQYAEKVLEMEADKAQTLLEEHRKKQMQEQEILDAIVAKEKALSVNYVTPENLDEAIENCLKSVEEFDFAIDLEGNKYRGREGLEKPKTKVGTDEDLVFTEDMTRKSESTTQPQ